MDSTLTPTLASSSTQSKKDDDTTINDSEKQLGKAKKDKHTKDKANKDENLDDTSSGEEDDSDDDSDLDDLDEDNGEDGEDIDAVAGKGLDDDNGESEKSDDEVDEKDTEDVSGGEEEGGEKEDSKESRESKLKPGRTSFGDVRSSFPLPSNLALYQEFITNPEKISKTFRHKTIGADGSDKLHTLQPPRLGTIRQVTPNVDKFLTDNGVMGEKTIPIVVPKPNATSASASGLSKPFTENASNDVEVAHRLTTFKDQIGPHASGSGITSSLGSLGLSSPGSPSVLLKSTSFQRPTLSSKFSEKSSFLNRGLKQNDEAFKKPSNSTFGVAAAAAAANTNNFLNSATPSSSSSPPSFLQPKVRTTQVSSSLSPFTPLAPEVSLPFKTTAETLPASPQKKPIPASNPIRNDNGHGGRDEDSHDDDDDSDTKNGNIGANDDGNDATSNQKDQQDKEEEEEEEDQHEDEDQDQDEDEEEEEEETPSENQRKINALKSKIWLQAKSHQLASGCKEFPFKISDSLETMTDNLVLYKKYLQLNRNIENCTSVYMLFMALTEELMCFLGLNAEGYAQFQMERMDEYKPCLMALGEKGYFCNGDEEGNVVNPGFHLLKLFALHTSFFMLGQYGSESVKALAGKMSLPLPGDRGNKRRLEEVGPTDGFSGGPPRKRGVGQNWLWPKDPLHDMKQLGFERANTVDEFKGQPFESNIGEGDFKTSSYYVGQEPPAPVKEDQDDQEDQDEDTDEDIE